VDLAYLDGRVKVLSVGLETAHIPHIMVITGIPAFLPLAFDSTKESPEIFAQEPASDKELGVIHEVADFDRLLLDAPL